MSTVGSKTRVKLTEEGGKMAAAAQTNPKGSKGREYHAAVSDLIESGETAGNAIKQVAERTGSSVSNISNAYYRVQRQSSGNGSAPSSRARTAAPTASTVSVPKDLAPLLDAIKKDKQSLSANMDKLVRWASAMEQKVADAQDNAREAALRQIREAAANLK